MKTAIVTGGSSGIGLGVTRMLLQKGYRVIITFVGNPPSIDSPFLDAYEVDQSDRIAVHNFINKIKSKYNSLECLILNAGITIRKSFTEYSDDDWDKMMEVSVNSHFIMVRDFFPIISPDSRIIFTGSQMGLSPHATVLAYGVTKAAIHAMVKNLVKEFDNTGTTVNAIVPGFVETPWQKEKPDLIKNNIYAKTAIHRFASVDEIVDGFRFCIDNPFVNGSLIEINGGYSYK